jgi:hypothetical protein
VNRPERGEAQLNGAELSRWTMSYFAAALLSLLAAEAMMSAGLGFPVEALRAPATLVAVHLVTIGWLSLTMCGALGQFIPVLTGRPLHSNRLPLPALALLVTGLVVLILGFLRLDGRVPMELPFLSVAALLLGAGFALVIWNLACTLWSARPLALPAQFMATGLAAVGVAATLGVIFALVLDQAMTGSVFARIHSGALPIHIIAGLGGWLTITTVGVSYRLLAMFMLAPDIDDARGRVTLRCAAAALGVTIVSGFAAVLAEMPLAAVLAMALVLATLALALYGRDILQLYRSRRRRNLELNSRMGGIALANLALSAVLCVVLAALGRFSEYVGAVVFLSAFGWLSGFMLAQMYKIIAFLTWLEVYGPVLGRAPTPRVQDLVAERPAMRWFMLFFAGVWGATGALLAGSTPIFRIGTLAMTAATCGIVSEMMKSRRLSHVPTALRLPGNAVRPMLLITATGQP